MVIRGPHLVTVGNRVEGPLHELGNVAILPGLVNAHTHLELSDADGPLGTPGMDLVDWLRAVMAHRREAGPAKRSPVGDGLRQSVTLGTTTLCDIAQSGWTPSLLEDAGCHTLVLLELIAPARPRIGPALEAARRHLESPGHVGFLGSWQPGLGPHAPYSVHPELLESVVTLAAERRAPIAFHLAESREEIELLHAGTGPFVSFLKERNAWQPGLIIPGSQPLDYLHVLARAPRVLVIHGNYLAAEEIAFLADRRDRMAVVYCPRTHAFFGHSRHPLPQLLAAGATVALGTDSRASAPDLSILAEMRLVAERFPEIPLPEVTRLGTLAGAEALGLANRSGSLEPGKDADLTVVALPSAEAADPHQLLFHSPEPVLATWRHGVEVSRVRIC